MVTARPIKSSSFSLLPLLLLQILILSACNGGGGGGGGSIGGVVSGSGGGVSGIVVGGSGSDGPVSGGTIYIYDKSGLCDSVTTNQDATYNLTLDSTCKPPYRIELSGGIDLVTNLFNDTTMLSLSMTSGQINVSPLTTIIYHAALARAGGNFSDVQTNDLELVTLWATRKFNFGIDAADPVAGEFNPHTTVLDSTNSAIFVKANEGLIETTRRVALLWTGVVTEQSIGEVLTALGEDISDGILDGKNIDNTQPPEMVQLSSFWEITAANVSLEMMLNQMSVTLTENQYKQEGVSELTYTDVNDGLAIAASTVSDISYNTAATTLQNIEPTRLFIDQARSAATAASELASQTIGASYFNNFIAALDTMKSNLNASGTRTTPVTGFDSTLINAMSGNSTTILNDQTFTPANYSQALQYSVVSMNESTPVLVADNKRHVLIEWSYPSYSNIHNGFKIYRKTANNQNQLICTIANPDARSTAGYNCYIKVQPGEEITLFMSAFGNTESSPSTEYTNALPEAQFTTADSTSGNCPLSIDFTANGQLSQLQGVSRDYQWDLGDGNTASSGDTTYHTYNYPSNYTVAMTVTDTDYTGIFSTSNKATLDVACW